MASTTTIAISVETRTALRELAIEHDDTMESLLRRMIRQERARRMGAALALRRTEMSPGDMAVERALIVAAGVAVAGDALG